MGRAFFGLLFLLACVPELSVAAPALQPIPGYKVRIKLPAYAVSDKPTITRTPDELAKQVQNDLRLARQNGDPRFLGYAQRALEQWPEDEFTTRLLVLRATLRQSLHHFQAARDDIKKVVNSSHDRTQLAQAWLTKSGLELAQGRYDAAAQACDKVSQYYRGLIAESCHASVTALTGNAQAAYDQLKNNMARSRKMGTNRTSLSWAEGTLAGIAAQLGLPVAKDHFKTTLKEAPKDLYSRAAYADWLVDHEEFAEAAEVTKGYERVDNLAVLRAIALRHLDDHDADPLIENLHERFEEARWRGNFLHKRDLARFFLDVENDPEAAFPYAWKNWQTQREAFDTRLALRAAQAAGKTEALQTLRQWLQENHQQDVRYPKVRP